MQVHGVVIAAMQRRGGEVYYHVRPRRATGDGDDACILRESRLPQLLQRQALAPAGAAAG